MRKLSDRVKRLIVITILTVLTLCLFGLVLYGYSIEKDRNETLTALQEEAEPLEKQISEIQNKIQLIDLQTTNADISYVSIAFYVHDPDDFDTISDLESQYNINASVIINVEDEDKEELVQEAINNENEIILTYSDITDKVKEEASELKETLKEQDASCFFASSSSTSESSIQSLKDIDFDGAITYSQTVENQRYDNGLVTYGYIYVSSDGLDINSKLSPYITNKQCVCVIIDMHYYDKGLTPNGVENLLSTINDIQDAGDIKLNITTSIITTINNIKDIDEESNNDIQQYKEELTEQLNDLQSQVDEIYARWNK